MTEVCKELILHFIDWSEGLIVALCLLEQLSILDGNTNVFPHMFKNFYVLLFKWLFIRYQQENKTGYYPAIDFFKSLDGVDPDLITSAEQVAWLVSKLARETIQKKLRPIFSSVSFQSIQTLAFSMPKVRPNQKDAIEQLARHYTPDSVKIELVLNMMRRDSDDNDDRAEPYARKMMFRWLESEFESIEVTNSKAI